MFTVFNSLVNTVEYYRKRITGEEKQSRTMKVRQGMETKTKTLYQLFINGRPSSKKTDDLAYLKWEQMAFGVHFCNKWSSSAVSCREDEDGRRIEIRRVS